MHHMRTTKAADGAFFAQGIEIGSGFSGARMLGSEHNDEFFMSPDGEVRTRTNRCGPCLPHGGTRLLAMPLVFSTSPEQSEHFAGLVAFRAG